MSSVEPSQLGAFLVFERHLMQAVMLVAFTPRWRCSNASKFFKQKEFFRRRKKACKCVLSRTVSQGCGLEPAQLVDGIYVGSFGESRCSIEGVGSSESGFSAVQPRLQGLARLKPGARPPFVLAER